MARQFIFGIILISLAVSAAPAATSGDAENAPHTQAELILENTAIKPGSTLTAAVHLKMQNGWHTYWLNPGDSGMATSLRWTLPPGFRSGPILWPAPKRIAEVRSINFGYENEVALLAHLDAPDNLRPGSSVVISVKVEWLECRSICVPGKAVLSKTLAVAAQTQHDTTSAQYFTQARQRLPMPFGFGRTNGWSITASHEDKNVALRLTSPNGFTAQNAKSASFFPFDDSSVNNEPGRTYVKDGTLAIELPMSRAPGAAQAKRLTGVLALEDIGLFAKISAKIKN